MTVDAEYVLAGGSKATEIHHGAFLSRPWRSRRSADFRLEHSLARGGVANRNLTGFGRLYHGCLFLLWVHACLVQADGFVCLCPNCR